MPPWLSTARPKPRIRVHGAPRSSVGLALALALLAATPRVGMVVPIEIQVPLLVKVLEFDRSLRSHPGEELVILVAYQSRFRDSREVKDQIEEWISAVPSGRINGRALRWEFVDLEGRDGLAAELDRRGAGVVYLAPLRAVDVNELTAAAGEARALSVTGDLDHLDEGVAVTFGTRGGRPSIIINLKAARAAGADFSAQLLQVAEIVNP
jgi:hypothetical protein